MSPRPVPNRPLVGALLGAATIVLLTAPPASATPSPLAAPAYPAATATPAPSPSAPAAAAVYRSWGFYHLKDGAWEFAQTGPSGTTPAEGSVDGWRFATSDFVTPRLPRATPAFADICGKTPAESGKKRVGVVVDYGRPADGPEGAAPPAPVARCALVPTAATSSQVLAAVSQPREDKGMVCAIDDYPGGTECAAKLPAMPAAAMAADDKVDIAVTATTDQPAAAEAPAAKADEGPSKTLLTGVAVVVVAAAAAGAYLVRRRTSA